MSNQERHGQLLSELEDKYKEIGGITWDGPNDWDVWGQQKPRIMFLLKEAYDDGEPQYWNHKFSPNVLRWKYALQELYKDINTDIPYLSNEQPSNFTVQMKEIAFVEVIKHGANSTTLDKALTEAAIKDKLELREQIELINPHIIFCGKTIDACDIIFGDINEELVSKEKIEKCGCYNYNGRLIVDFYHPSRHHAFRMTDEEMFNLLCKIVKEGKNGSVFNEFNWE